MEPLNDPAALAAELAELANAPELEPCTVPNMDRLSFQAQDIIARYTGVEIADPDTAMPRKMAANEWFWRRLRGQSVTYADVFASGCFGNLGGPANPTRASD